MIELTNLAAQTLQPGQALTFDKELLNSRCGSECFNSLIPTSVKLTGRRNGNGCAPTYDVEFHANIGTETAATAVQLAIAVGGTALPQGLMDATPATVDERVNVSAGTYLKTCCSDLGRVSIINSGTTPVIVNAGANLRISRRA